MAANKKITISTSALSQDTDMDDLVDLISRRLGKRCKLKNIIKDSHGKTVRCDIELHKDCDNDDRHDADMICRSHLACGKHHHSPCGNHTVVDQGTFEQFTANQAISSATLGTAPATLTASIAGSGATTVGSANNAGNGSVRALSVKDSDTSTSPSGANYTASYSASITVSADQVLSPNTEVSLDFKLDSSIGTAGDIASSLTITLGSSDPNNGSQAVLNINLITGNSDNLWTYYNGSSFASLNATYTPGAYNSIKIKNVPGGVAEMTLNGVTDAVPDGGDFSSSSLIITITKVDTYSTSGAHTQQSVLIDNVKMVVV